MAPLPGDSRLSASIASELVGRESQFSHVLSAWEQARAGSPRVLVVTAAAGLGKSRLLRDVQARLRASRARCVLVRANPGDRHLSAGFAAEVASQVAALPGAAAISTGSAGVLVSLAPALAATYPNAAPDSSDGEEAVRRRALAAIDLMRAVSDEQPVAILLDDLHWADEHSARVIAAALSRLEHARVLVVMTKRVMADPRAHFSGFEQLELPPLDLAAVSSFVSHVAHLPATPWADILPQQLLLATGGSPLLLVETLHDALEQGWLKCSAAGIWECEDPSRITLFLREGSAVRQRVQRLSPTARHGLLALAILGRPVRLEDARAMMAGRAVELEEPLEVLERGGFIMRHGTDLVVAHDEIADAVAEASSVEERRRIHAAIAQDLASRTGDEMALRRAAEHARAGGVDAALTQAWQAFLTIRRRAGDRRSTRQLAADFLTLEPGAQAVDRLVASTPMIRRQRTRWIAAAGVLLAATSALALVTRKPAPLTSDFTVWTVDSATGHGHFVGVRLPRDMHWDDNSPIEAVDLDATEFPTLVKGTKGRWMRTPNAKEWWTDIVDPVFGDESIFLDSLGRTSMPMASLGDDAIADFSPDGRFFLGVTARFDTLTDHLHLVTGTPNSGALRRLTLTADYDRSPAWGPDGTQIAFQRHFYTRRDPDQLCLIDVDGGHERCLAGSLEESESLVGWIDERRLLLSGRGGRLATYDAVTGVRTPVDRIRSLSFGTSGSLRLCECTIGDGGVPSFFVFPASDPAAARPVRYRGKPLRGSLRHWAPLSGDRQWLDTLRLEVRPTSYLLGTSHRLQVHAVRANGAPAWVHDLRWSSRDTTVATVDSTGLLRPQRVGSVWIVVSAGGWRTDSAQLRIVPTSSQPVVVERWSDGWDRRWRVFGIPSATVVRTARGSALLPNGDGSYGSGAYLLTPFSAASGAGIEADVSLLVTGTQWQTLAFDIIDARMLAQLRTWDHRTGDRPSPINPSCTVGFPGAEGATFRDNFSVSGRLNFRLLKATPTLLDGSWHRIRLQYLPDGRCLLAVDGQPMATVFTVAPVDSVTIVVTGNDKLGGRLIVGTLDVWSGVRGGVDWTKLDGGVAQPPP
ncbi:MAG: AAA family ATPase [Gemmatimonadetes bacterium]|nr:AAA family ATPase [Gemmatimonadota bacterium]